MNHLHFQALAEQLLLPLRNRPQTHHPFVDLDDFPRLELSVPLLFLIPLDVGKD